MQWNSMRQNGVQLNRLNDMRGERIDVRVLTTLRDDNFRTALANAHAKVHNVGYDYNAGIGCVPCTPLAYLHGPAAPHQFLVFRVGRVLVRAVGNPTQPHRLVHHESLRHEHGTSGSTGPTGFVEMGQLESKILKFRRAGWHRPVTMFRTTYTWCVVHF